MNIYEILNADDTVTREELQRRFDRLADVYNTIYITTQDEDTRQIARERLDQLFLAGKEAALTWNGPDDLDLSPAQDPLTGLRKDDSENGRSIRAATFFAYSDDEADQLPATLPDTAQKHGLLARAALEKDNTLEGCEAAVNELARAADLDPGNAAYHNVLDALEEHVQDVTAEQRRQALEDQRKAEEEARAARAEAARQTAGAVGRGLLGALGCCCEACCESCEACSC